MSIRKHQSLKTQILLYICFTPYDKYLVVSADRAPKNIVFVRKSHYIDCLIKGLRIDNSLGSPTYYPTTIIGLFLCYCGISIKDEETGSTSTLLSYTSVILLECPNAPCNLFANY